MANTTCAGGLGWFLNLTRASLVPGDVPNDLVEVCRSPAREAEVVGARVMEPNLCNIKALVPGNGTIAFARHKTAMHAPTQTRRFGMSLCHPA